MGQSTLYSFTLNSSSLNNQKMYGRGKSTGGSRQRNTRGEQIIRLLTGPKPGPKKKLSRINKRPDPKGDPKINLDLAKLVLDYLSEYYQHGSMNDPTPKEREEETERLESFQKDLLWSRNLCDERRKDAQKKKESFEIRYPDTNSIGLIQYGEKLDDEVRAEIVKNQRIEEALKKNSESISEHAEYCENADLFEKNKKIREDREKGRARDICKSDHRKTKELCGNCKNKTKNGRVNKNKICKTCRKNL